MELAPRKNRLTGEHEHVLDDKSRVIIPIKWREELKEKIFLCCSLDQTPCIWGFSEDEFNGLSDRMQRGIGLGDSEGQNQLRVFSRSVEEVEVDRQGRIPLSEKVRNYAMIPARTEGGRGPALLLVGMGMVTPARFEIWRPDLLEKALAGTQIATVAKKIEKSE